MTAFDEPLPDGVYLDLSAQAYFRQETRGSTDWIRLHQQGEGWWWSSPYNPDHVPQKRPYQAYGSALHALMLEGPEAYLAQFAVRPDPSWYPRLARTVDDIKEAFAEANLKIEGSSKFSKAQWLAAMRDYLPDRWAWDNIMADWRLAVGTRIEIDAVEDRMIRLMHRVALDPERADNAAIRKLLTPTPEHPVLAEVSVLAEIDGIRRRWRFDRLFPGLTMDLKSLGNWRGRPLPWEVGEVLARHSWDIQREDYHIGREQAYRLIREGRLFGGSIEARRYIQDIAASNPTWDWVWLVYQKPEPTGRAPVLFPVWDDSWTIIPGQAPQPSPIRQWGRNKLDRAIALYRRMVETVGLDKPWARVEPLHYTDDAMQPRIHLPHWIADEEPTTAVAYDAPTEEAEHVE